MLISRTVSTLAEPVEPVPVDRVLGDALGGNPAGIRGGDVSPVFLVEYLRTANDDRVACGQRALDLGLIVGHFVDVRF